jgi:peroxiredoxin Q/BCP
MQLRVGDIAPDFSLPDQNGNNHKLSDYKKHWVLIYFYPKDNTPGCTKEACAIRDNYAGFKELNAKVLGISTDSVESHSKFSEKQKLPFILLSDIDKKVVNLYGVFGKKKFMGREFKGTKRTSFLLKPGGIIAKIYENVKPVLHAQEVTIDIDHFNK